MMELKILIVEDEFIATQYLCDILNSRELFNISSVHTATNAQDAQEIVKNNPLDLIFMDINLEGSQDGITCANTIGQKYDIPIIYTTAYKDSQTMQEAFQSNLYGYLTKPFKPSDVEATLLVTLKLLQSKVQTNKEAETSQRIVLGNYHYNPHNKTLLNNNHAINLTKKESDLIDLFFNNINQNLSYDLLKEVVWKRDDISDSTVRDAVSKLKRKVVGLTIENISSVGYILKTAIR